MLRMLIVCSILMLPPLAFMYFDQTMMVALWGLVLCFYILMYAKAWLFFVGLEFWFMACSEIFKYKDLVPSIPVHFQQYNFIIYPEFIFYFLLTCMVYDSAKAHLKLRRVAH